jgi:hypothetical protein
MAFGMFNNTVAAANFNASREANDTFVNGARDFGKAMASSVDLD